MRVAGASLRRPFGPLRNLFGPTTMTLARPLIATLATLVFAVAPQLPAAAQSVEPEAATSNWGLGLGVGAKRKPYVGVDTDTSVLPLLRYENEHLRFFGTTLDAKLGTYAGFSFTARAKVDLLGSAYEASDSPALAGMAERKGSLWLGGTAAWQAGDFTLSIEALADGSSESRGRQLKLAAEHDFRFGSWQLTPRAAVTAYDGKYVDYYYGVRSGEATAVRPFYAGRRAAHAELGLQTVYGISPHHSLMLDVSSEFLGGATKDSPIVDRSSVPSARFAYLYSF